MGNLELVTLKTTDNLSLDGAWYSNPKNSIGALLIHGRGQNFYTSVVRWLAPFFAEIGISSLALNMRDHDHTEEDGIPEAHLDIEAGINFLADKGFDDILLIGVSYGSNKAVLSIPYVSKSKHLKGLILMSAGGVKSYLPDVWNELLAILHTLETPVLLLQAGKDEYVEEPRSTGEALIAAIARPDLAKLVVIPDANHAFSNNKEEVFREILAWLPLKIEEEFSNPLERGKINESD